MKIACDNCDIAFPMAARVNICQARPSDPAELCAVMYFCAPCAKEQGEFYLDKRGGMGTYEFLQEKFENGEADALGYLWLTV